jgi:hypothetical protein
MQVVRLKSEHGQICAVVLGIAIAGTRIMSADRGASSPSPSILACLWEIANGTRALLLEHHDTPRWELRTVRGERVFRRFRFEAIGDLMARSLAEYMAAAIEPIDGCHE